MSKKWILLTSVLSLSSVGTSQAHPLDSPEDISHSALTHSLKTRL
jgi:hypothetical protein